MCIKYKKYKNRPKNARVRLIETKVGVFPAVKSSNVHLQLYEVKTCDVQCVAVIIINPLNNYVHCRESINKCFHCYKSIKIDQEMPEL